jgi:hypothetical protein
MNNMEQVLRLLKELERLDRDTDHESDPPTITSSALLKALVKSDFDLTTAILDVHIDS